MGGGASTQRHLAEIKRLKEQNELLKRQTVLQEKKLGLLMSELKDKKTFMANIKDKKKRLAVSSEVLREITENEKFLEDFKPPVFKKNGQEQNLIMTLVIKHILFKGLSQTVLADCVGAFKKEPEVSKGTVLIKQGDDKELAQKFYVVESGNFSVSVNGEIVGTVGPGEGVGELALLYNQPRAATITATEDAKVWSLNRRLFNEIKIAAGALQQKKIKQYLKTVEILKVLKDEDLTALAHGMEEAYYDDKAYIIRQGLPGDDFYIVFKGQVDVYKKEGDGERKKVKTCNPGEYFGELALLSEDMRAASCIANGPVTVLVLDRQHFEDMIGSLNAYADGEKSPRSATDTVVKPNDGSDKLDIKFAELENVGILGEGAFGRVSLVKQKNSPDGTTYALKAMQKELIVNNNLQEHTLNEKSVMEMLNHPFLLKLHNSYQDDRYLYLLIELCQGGELFAYLRERGNFTEQQAKFYAAGVTLGFQDMHQLNICYRDLKPENLLLDSNGFLKICDFGLAKVVNDKTFTLCGTPDYLAPEIITSKGHNKSCDYWALGILIYEMTVGDVPFYADDPMMIYQLILRHDLQFPYKMSKGCKDIVSKLLNSNPSKRLGNLKGQTKDVIKHKWFASFDFESMVKMNKDNLNIPIEPEVSSSTDTSNFDTSDIEAEGHVAKSSWEPSGFEKC
eukprot:g700.t1